MMTRRSPGTSMHWFICGRTEYIGVVYFVCVHTLLKVVSHYDSNVLSMSVMSFQKVCIELNMVNLLY